MDLSLVAVEWEDAYADKPEWATLEDLLDTPPAIVTSVGYLLAENHEGRLILIGAAGGEGEEWTGGGRQVIPVGMVRNIRRLTYEDAKVATSSKRVGIPPLGNRLRETD